MVHTDNIKHRFTINITFYNHKKTTRTIQDTLTKNQCGGVFQLLLKLQQKVKCGVNELTGSTSHTQEGKIIWAMSELGGECTYLISLSHQFDFSSVCVVCCFCYCSLLWIGGNILKSVFSPFSIRGKIILPHKVLIGKKNIYLVLINNFSWHSFK